VLDLPNLTIHDWRHVTPEVVADMTADELLDTYAVALTFTCRPGLSVAAGKGWTDAANLLRDAMRARMGEAVKRKRS
jgi:hypothetical protein